MKATCQCHILGRWGLGREADQGGAVDGHPHQPQGAGDRRGVGAVPAALRATLSAVLRKPHF